MEEDPLCPNIPGLAAEIGVADLPDDIMALFYSHQEYLSNAAKQKAEALTIIHSANLSAIDSRISGIDGQIARLHSHREELVSKRHQESRNVQISKSIQSPIRTVPTDILCEIFVHCLPKPSTSAPINTLDPAEAPLLLCQVCSKWRTTALDFPPLWKALALRARYVASHDKKHFILTIPSSVSSILDRWVARARSCLLSLAIDHHEGDIYEKPDLTLNLEDVLSRPPNSRLQHLSLSFIYPSDIYFLSRITQEFTELESIFLQTDYGPGYALPPDRLLQSAPRLHSAELHSFIHQQTFQSHLLPWSQLTHLRIEDQLGEKMWYTLICLCTNLQHGIFSVERNSRFGPTIPTSSHDVLLPHLVDLTVHVPKDGHKPDFRQLVFPALRRLQLLFEDPVVMNPPYAWDSHFPATDLKSLIIIAGTDFAQAQLQSFCNSSSSVTELRHRLRRLLQSPHAVFTLPAATYFQNSKSFIAIFGRTGKVTLFWNPSFPLCGQGGVRVRPLHHDCGV